MTKLHRDTQTLRGAHRLVVPSAQLPPRRRGGRGATHSTLRIGSEAGAATAEYAIVTLAAVAFAGLLVAILRSDEVRSMLLDLVQRALSFGG
ncbi:MAG: DUF4244 domain-containing protein [Terrimesophilobacter sp.]